MRKSFKCIIGISVGIVIGSMGVSFLPQVYRSLSVRLTSVLTDPPEVWPSEFKVVQIKSTFDDEPQPAYWRAANGGDLRPLLVSFRTWYGDYSQQDPLARLALEANWNYIHPHLRGPNNTPAACLSPEVFADIEDTIAYALHHGSVDEGNIFVVGLSGGGHAALGAYLRSDHPIKAILAWVPITDLEAWYWQTKARGMSYAQDILAVSGKGSGGVLDADEVRKRSPLYMQVGKRVKTRRLELYAGIKDGHGDQSVPVSHSILFYNKMAHYLGFDSLDYGAALSMMSRSLPVREDMPKLSGRKRLFYQSEEPISLSIFDGGHEMLSDYCFQRLIELSGEK